MSKMTATQIRVAAAIADMADDGGMIQDYQMRELQQARHVPNDPTYCTAMQIDRAWVLAGLNADDCRNAMGW